MRISAGGSPGDYAQNWLEIRSSALRAQHPNKRAADRIRVPDFRFFAVSLVLQRQTGGGIAEILSNLSGIIRQRKALRMKARALTAEAQASAAIIATTPFVAGVGLFLINRDLTSVLFTDPRGRFLLGIAVASLLTGLAAMRALIKKNLR